MRVNLFLARTKGSSVIQGSEGSSRAIELSEGIHVSEEIAQALCNPPFELREPATRLELVQALTNVRGEHSPRTQNHFPVYDLRTGEWITLIVTDHEEQTAAA